MAMTLTSPLVLLAELTHRCPLSCPYCSNPLELERRGRELDTQEWERVLREARALGVLQAHLSGGEPTARRDLEEIVAVCAQEGLYSNLITSGVGLTSERLARLSEAGLDHVQLSLQAIDEALADRIAGLPGAHRRKRAVAEAVTALGLPLTINAVIHRANIHETRALIDHAVALGARRIEIAHAQFVGWGLLNRPALLPRRAAVEESLAAVETARRDYAGVIVIDAVIPDYHARYPKPCMGGWGRMGLNVTPSGRVLPCHAAENIPGLDFWSVREHSLEAIWRNSPSFNAFRGEDWMREPCRSCDRRNRDFGGCRCQAMALTGDAAATDPVCHLSPHRNLVEAALAEAEAADALEDYRYRGYGAP